jgi:hypothetical protein
VYFTSKVLHGAEERYPRIEKLAYALVISARRLRPYFQAHAVRVLTEYPLRKVRQKLDLSGRLVNWAIELGEFDIEYHPRTVTKAQALADFVVEMGESPDEEGSSKGPTWVAYVDGSSAGGGSGAGVVFRGLTERSSGMPLNLISLLLITKPSMRLCFRPWKSHGKWE